MQLGRGCTFFCRLPPPVSHFLVHDKHPAPTPTSRCISSTGKRPNQTTKKYRQTNLDHNIRVSAAAIPVGAVRIGAMLGLELVMGGHRTQKHFGQLDPI